jgi:hypothetical protein
MASSSVRAPDDRTGAPHRQDAEWLERRTRPLNRGVAVVKTLLSFVLTRIGIGVIAE